MRRSTLPALLTISLIAGLAACAQPPGTDPPRSGSQGTPPSGAGDELDVDAARAAVAALPASLIERFAGCDDLLTYYRANALELVGPWGLGGGYGYAMAGDGEEAAADSAGVASSGSGGEAPAHSTTNVQEAGVDEADMVKTDGRIIVTTINGKVRVVDVASERVVSTISMPGRTDSVYPHELLLNGSTLVVLSYEENYHAVTDSSDNTYPAFGASRTLVTTVDLSNPAAPRTLGSVRVEGSYVSARMIGETVRLVMQTDPPGLQQTYPTKNTMAAEDEAEERNRQLILDSTIDDWVPHVQQLDADGDTLSTERLLDCDDISRPRDPAGLSTMAVLTFDVGSESPEPTSATGLVASGSTVYASTDRLVVATSRWDSWRWSGNDALWSGDAEMRTDLHSFDISDPDGTTYQASGSVDGYLLSQWALDEEAGVLRVATTTDPPGISEESESSLIMMREDGDQLVETGRVDGLGLTEQVRAVRYLSPDLAAVVTFRQTDPLYLMDTSDPTAPQVTGELKIPGYSAYLHPVGEDTLIGVGQDADPETGQTNGMQVSLFDISDLTAPRQTEVLNWKDSYTTVEWDHRAFTYWPATGQAFVPMSRWYSDDEKPFAGVVVLGVGEDRLTEQGTVEVSPKGDYWGEGPVRTLVIGDDLWTLEWQGMGRFDLDTMQGEWVLDLP
ncbi:beta-propeller domain-containing protein [Ornithinimicrobium sp. F0845]|uniref:beta-propeller domain-containing protein n=1 Tax=Ornithinimicrobium sp. F0845 TaxID=2926412 RepID=UPI001FF12C07|nr:beta-propeller domain-containing protein [Ornithinimicrobium sp. F0845]MCK0110630.1 beta-propeller domain-containing protein [Ornithinimicrobium sp. F0845]